MFTLAYKKSKFKLVNLNSPEEIPTDETYVNMYVNENTSSIYTLDNQR
jgi:hypothetical protein